MIQRTAWLKRGKPPRRKRKEQRRSSRVHDVAWLAEVRKLPCCAPRGDSQCRGPVQADHVGRRGLGQKSSDRETIPLCDRHHQQRDGRDGNRGPFRGWTAARLRTWLDERIAETQTTVIGQLAGVGGSPESFGAPDGPVASKEAPPTSAVKQPVGSERAERASNASSHRKPAIPSREGTPGVVGAGGPSVEEGALGRTRST